ncbi:MAG: 4Fe-4S dicluster domain-containing protein [Deltaproteobacteria bacterium]|nr:4Fe-4S dicluster domain-containing protein [Deltaproteobacteria bacterium]
MTLIEVYILGKKYAVPRGLTILKALEYAGFGLTRGCGCRGGVCGACLTVYRRKGDFRLKTGLACQTVVEPDMYLTQLPYLPGNRTQFPLPKGPVEDFAVAEYYPELMRCVACNTCTKNCPMELQVMDYIAAAKRGDLEAVYELSVECVMCGMCAARCPAELTQFNIALLLRRVRGKNLPRWSQLDKRLGEIEQGVYAHELADLKTLKPEGLIERFKQYQATRGEAI